MNLGKTHPEGLIDLALEGQLRGKNIEELKSHLDECSTCNLERQLQQDFAFLVEPFCEIILDEEEETEPLDAASESAIEKTLQRLVKAPLKSVPGQSG